MLKKAGQKDGTSEARDAKLLRAFLLRFAVITLVLMLVPFIPGWDQFISRYLQMLAFLMNGMLHWFGEPTKLQDCTVLSNAYNVTLAPNCAAWEAAFFYCGILLAYPTSLGRKVIGMVVGLLGIVALNLLRVLTVYFTGAHWRAHMDTVHELVWPVLMVIGTAGLCALWLSWAGGRRAA